MTQKDELKQSMNTVAQAFDIIKQFHQNIADLFRLITHDLEDGEPSYIPMLHNGEIWTSSLQPILRKSSNWQLAHCALPLSPFDDEDAPIILINISTDTNFNKSPEVWLGLFSNIQTSKEPFPFTESIEYIFQDYFGPEDDWSELGTWYHEHLEDEDEGIELDYHFCRVSLGSLIDRATVHQEIAERLREQIKLLS